MPSEPSPAAGPNGAPRPIRALFINAKRRPPLGADTWVHLGIMRHLDRDLVEVHAACVTGPPDQPTPTYEGLREIDDVELVKVNLGREIAGETITSKIMAVLSLIPAAWSIARLTWYVKRRQIDVIHAADRPRDAAAAVVIGRLTRTPSVVHIHVGYDPNWMRGMLQWAIRRADALLAISEFVAGTLSTSGHPSSSIHLVLNGIDVDRWEPGAGRAEVRTELGIAPDTPVVVTACRLFRGKGVTELVQALHDADVADAVLLIAGAEMEGGYLDELRSLAADLGVGDRVHFLGRRSDIDHVMAAADVFAMPSHEEPFGLVFAEAMALGLPVVGLSDGGTPEVVRDGVDGLLSAYRDPEALAANLRALLLDPARREQLGANGRRRALDELTSVRMAADAATALRAIADS